jgi:hypothetical protein
MHRRLALGLLAGLALAGNGGAGATAVKEQRPIRSTDQPRPRDGNVAIQEELDAARRAGTPEAYDLFLRRHPGHPLTKVARRERADLPAPRR